MKITKGRLLSVAIAADYVVAAMLLGTSLGALGGFCLTLLLPLGLIWFADISIPGWVGPAIPRALIAASGWLLLIAYPPLLHLVVS